MLSRSGKLEQASSRVRLNSSSAFRFFKNS